MFQCSNCSIHVCRLIHKGFNHFNRWSFYQKKLHQKYLYIAILVFLPIVWVLAWKIYLNTFVCTNFFDLLTWDRIWDHQIAVWILDVKKQEEMEEHNIISLISIIFQCIKNIIQHNKFDINNISVHSKHNTI